MFLEEFKSEGNIIFQMEWFGVNPRLNETSKRWHTGQAEKVGFVSNLQCISYLLQIVEHQRFSQSGEHIFNTLNTPQTTLTYIKHLYFC